MAETFEKYTKMRDTGGHLPLEQKIDLAMDQGELIRGVAARVTAYVRAYEGFMEWERKHVKEVRENPDATERARSIADNMELDYQTLMSAPDDPKNARLLLDDLKVLLDLLPEGYKP